MTAQDNKDEKQAAPSNPQDLATAYREITKGEQTAAQLEANLTNLESKLDAMLAAFEEQEAPGTATTTTAAAADVNGKNSSGGGKDA